MLTVAQMAADAGISPDLVRAHCRAGSIKLTRIDLARLCADIRGGRATFVKSDRNFPSRAIFGVWVKGRRANVVYCHELGEIITVLPRQKRLGVCK